MSARTTLRGRFVQISSRSLALLALAAASVASAQVATNVDLPRYPSISPDGRTLAFTWRGDIFTVPATGGVANRLTASPYDDLYSAFSPDGTKLAFSSARAGPSNLYTLDLDGTNLRQVTFLDRAAVLTQWSPADGGRLLMSSMLEPQPFSAARPYSVPVEGGDISRVFDAVGSFPVVSPDGTKVLFNRGTNSWSRRGNRGSDNRDVWVYDRSTKAFTRLTAFNGNDGKARWLDDSTVVFISERDNNTNNLFLLKLGSAEATAKRLTNYTGEGVDDFDVAPASKQLVFSRWNRLHTLDLASASPEPREVAVRASEEESDRVRFEDVRGRASEAALSPDGKTVAVIAYGELYVRGTDSRSPTRRVATNLPGRKRDVAFSADGERIFFVCDEAGKEQLYEARIRTTRTELRRKFAPATRPAGDGAEEAASRPAPHSTTAPAASEPAPQPASPEAVDAEGSEQQRRSLPPGVTLPAGATGAAAGASASAGGAAETSKWADAIAFDVRKLQDADRWERFPIASPDGRTLAFIRGTSDGQQLILRDEDTGKERVAIESFSGIEFRFSPDSRHLAYTVEDRNNNRDVFLMPADGSWPAVNLSRHPNGDFSPRFSADGKILAFMSNRLGDGDETQVYSVYLDKDTEQLAGPDLDAYFRDAAAAARRRTPPATRPASTQPATQPQRQRRASTRPAYNKAHLDEAYLRLRQVTSVRGGVSELELAPAGDRFYFIGGTGAQRGLMTLSREATEPSRIANAGNVQMLSLTGDQLLTIEAPPAPSGDAPPAPRSASSRVALVRLPSGETEYVDPSDRLRVDLAQLSRQKFLEASRIMANVFYDPKMSGLDWNAHTAKYLPLALAARTSDEFDFVANRFIGDLNASHLGVNSPSDSSPLAQPSGRLGISTTRTADGFRVDAVTTDGPADRGTMKLKAGDVLTHVDAQPIGPRDTLEKLLVGKVGVETLFTVTRDGKNLDLLLTPTSFEALSSLAYNQWRLAKLEEVRKLSNGRLGYIHIQGMSQASLEVYKRDLFAAVDGKDGLVIDVRWNGGGSTTDYLLASIMAPYHSYAVSRGAPYQKDNYPHDRLFIPRFIGPINMLCNERSFSNAETISHAFKTLKRGTLVGNQTAGGVISTGSASLLDGTTVRTPGRGWYLPDGTNMEMNGATPDILIIQSPEDEVNNTDRQLKAAVEDLMKRLK